MVSNFQFLAKALRFPATAPTLLALSLTAFVASQLHDRLSSQAFPDPSDDRDSDNAPDDTTVSLEPAAPAPSSPEQLSPEQLPLELPVLDPSLLEGLPKLALSPDLLREGIQPQNLAKTLPNLEVSLPQPLPQKDRPAEVRPVTPVRVSPKVLGSAISQSLAYNPASERSLGTAETVNVSSSGMSDLDKSPTWADLQQHWSKPYVEALATLGLINGLPNGHFDPDRPVTRAELADLLQRSFPRPENRPGIPPLVDVPAQHWAAESINRAVSMGFFPDAESTGRFNPDRPASRLVTWGAIVSGLNLPSSRQHNELLQAWEASESNPPAGTPNALTLEEELNQPVTRGEVAALLYHALRFTEEGRQLAFIPPNPAPAGEPTSVSEGSSVQGSPVQAAFASSPEALLPVDTRPVLTPAPDNTEVSPSHSVTKNSLEYPSQPPLLVAAQLPLPDPLLSPLPPLSEETPETVESDAIGSNAIGSDTSSDDTGVFASPTSVPSASPVFTSERISSTERVYPEFSAELLPLAASQGSASQGSASPGDLLQPNFDQNSEQNLNQTSEPGTESLDETYTLGPGDRVFIEVFGLPQYSQEYQVLVDGSLNLPRAGRMVVEGMTLAQAESLIYGRYARYYQQPATSVVLVAPRSLRIAVTGEVNRPGVYRLSPSEGTAVLSVTQALQEAGGIRQDADLRQVKLYRSQRNGDPQELALNLWSLLQTGDLNQDISLRDGDRLVIPKAEAFNVETVNQIATANIAPSTIDVTVVGSDTQNQGSLKVSPNTPLSQVVLAAGGFNDRRDSRTVNLIRLHPNGTVEQRILEVPIAANVNEENNPILRDKDVIVLDRSKGQVMRQGALGILGNIMRVIPFVNFFF